MPRNQRFPSSFPCGHGLSDITSIKPVAVFTPEAFKRTFEMAEEKSNPKLEEARSCFDEMMEASRKLTDISVKKELEEWIKEARDTYEEVVKDAWKTFKSGDSFTFTMQYKPEVDGARKEFEEETNLAVDKHLGEIDKKVRKDYRRKVKKVVDKYAEWGSSVFDSYDEVMLELQEKIKTKDAKSSSMGSSGKALSAPRFAVKSPPQQEQEQSMPKSKNKPKSNKAAEVQVKKTKQETEPLKSLPLNQQAPKPEEEEDDLPELMEILEEEVDDQSTMKSITSNEEKEVGQPLDSLEGQMLEMLKTMKEMKERLTSLQKKQEQQDKFLMKSLEEQMSKFRSTQMKAIDTVIANFKKGDLKQKQ